MVEQVKSKMVEQQEKHYVREMSGHKKHYKLTTGKRKAKTRQTNKRNILSETRKYFTLKIDTWSKRKEQKKNQDQMTRGEGNGASSNQRENEKIEWGAFVFSKKVKK